MKDNLIAKFNSWFKETERETILFESDIKIVWFVETEDRFYIVRVFDCFGRAELSVDFEATKDNWQLEDVCIAVANSVKD
jgi:hypothetical protein